MKKHARRGDAGGENLDDCGCISRSVAQRTEAGKNFSGSWRSATEGMTGEDPGVDDVAGQGNGPSLICGGVWRARTFLEPRSDAEHVDHNAEQVRRHESKLRGLEPDDADDCTIDAGDDKARPQLTADQDGGYHSEEAGKIIQAEHGE